MAETESLNFDIRLEARQAITTLEELTLKTSTFGERVRLVQAELKKFSSTTNMSFKSAKGVFQEVDKALSDTGKGSVLFGERAKQGWAEVGNGAEKAASKTTLASKAMMIGFGMLIHQGVNALFNAFAKLFSMAIKGLNEMEAAIFNIVNAEQRLSEQGLDVTIKDLERIIATIQELNPMLSKFQATELVSVIASKVAPALQLEAQDMERLAKQIAILAVRNQALGKSFEEVEQQVVTGLLSGRVTSGINQLGVKITEQAVQEEVLRQGLVKTEAQYKSLTSAEKEHADTLAIISILEKNTRTEEKNLPSYLMTVSGLTGIVKAEMSDLMTTIGQKLSPLIVEMLRSLIAALEDAHAWLLKNEDGIETIVGAVASLIKVFNDLRSAAVSDEEGVSRWERMKEAISGILSPITSLISPLFSIGNGFRAIIEEATRFRKKIDELAEKYPILKKIADALFGKGNRELSDYEDTPTSPQAPDIEVNNGYGADYVKAVEDVEKKVADIMQDAADKKLDIEQDYQEKREDIARDYARKLEDIARNTAQDIADANRDYGDKVSDINKDAAEKVAEVRDDSRKNDIEAEEKYQDELKNLREKYMMDLEDALRERDARQILRLMRQYQLDKQKALENRQKEREENAKQTAEKIADIEKERREKLAEAKKELAEKLRDIKLNAARERQEAAIARRRALEDARIAYNRQLADHREYLQRKLRDLQQAIQTEYQLTAAGQAALNNLFSQLTGSGSTTGSPIPSSQYTSSTPVVSSTWAQAGMYGTTGLAEGGSFLATKPTSINVAENRPELVTATPLGRPGQDLNKLFMNAGVGGGSESGMGQLELGITLSPDLEARVINKSMDAVGNVIMKINKTKV